MPDKYTYAQAMAEARRKQVAEKYGTSGKVSSNPKQPIPQQMPSRTDMRPSNNRNNRIFNWPDMEVSWGQPASGNDFNIPGDWASSALAVIGTLADISGTAAEMSNIADTSRQRGQVDDINTIGQTRYGNYGQIISDYDRLSYQPDLNYDDIRGGSNMERTGSVLSSALSGASTGAMFGPYGAAVGGVLGAGIAGVGWDSGNIDANTEYLSLLNDYKIGNYNAGKRINSGIEDYTDSEHRDRIGWISKYGGPINRKSNDATRSSGIIRERVDGGVKIKIKR